jgi:hypothetical protein
MSLEFWEARAEHEQERICEYAWDYIAENFEDFEEDILALLEEKGYKVVRLDGVNWENAGQSL